MKKFLVLGIASLMALCSLGLTACVEEDPVEEDPLAEHTAHEWTQTSTTQATCGEAGRIYYTCSVDGATTSKRTDAATGNHNYGDDNVCDDCGYIDMSGLTVDEAIEAYGYYVEDKDGSNTYTTGDVVYFGKYWQNEIADDALYATIEASLEEGSFVQGVTLDNELYAKLKAEEGTLPTLTSGADGWTSYGYYDNGSVSDYMFYKDVEVDGVSYRGVYLLKYRPWYSKLEASSSYSYIGSEGFELETVYWFEYSPIVWTVLDYENGNLFLNSKYCLEGQPYQALYEGDRSNLVIPGTSTYINDWEASTLRTFLNNDFYNNAFTSSEQALIQTVTLDNSTTGYEANARFQINQNSTQDKIFLLSYQDMLNTDYGFTATASYDVETNGDKINDVPEAMNRRRSYTAYSTIQGCRTSVQGNTADGDHACWYMLRSAGNVMYGIAGVNKYGSAVYTGAMSLTSSTSQDGLAYNGDFGVLPSLYIKVGK